MARLFKSYWSKYQRWSRPALRWNELERDTLLNQQVCVDHVLEVLAVDALVRRYLEQRFWPALYDSAKRDAEPPRPHSGFQKALRTQLTPQIINQWLAEAVNEPEPEYAVRPAMSERLFNLGSERLAPVCLEGENAANALLPGSLVSVISEIDKGWRARVRDRWQREHARHAKGRACLAALQRRSLTRRIKGHHAMTYAKLAKHYLTTDDAVAVYRRIAEMNPDDANVLIRVGRLLLSDEVDEGAALVNRATRLDPRLARKAQKILAHFQIATDGSSSMKDAVGAVA
jgi:hypothetical protein